MEITNEIKTKVFAQYLGQEYKTGDLEEPKIFPIIGETITCFEMYPNGTETDKIILKPLSAITHTDAFELYKIMVGNDFEERYIETFKNGEGVKHDSIMKNVNAYQYLQSKGYDLPNYLLCGKTLNEAGLAIYETN